MNRKKLRLIIIALSLFFFSVSSFANYAASYKNIRSDIHSTPNEIISGVQNFLRRDEALSVRLEASGISAADYIAFIADRWISASPHQTAVLDEDKRIISLGETAVFIDSVDADIRKCYFFKLEEYMTSSLRKEMLRFRYFNSNSSVKYISFNQEGDTYIPVEICLECSGTKKAKSFYFTDNEPTKTFKDNLYNIYFSLWGEGESLFEKNYTEMLREKLDDEMYRGTQYTTTTGSMLFPVEIGEGNSYQLYVAVKKNPYTRALTSPYFLLTEILLLFAFTLPTVFLLVFSMKYLKKKEELEKSKRAFISAAAHELKTPLAVIQNQCECILEGVVDEKKDEYIKSVYEEALRMNDIVTSLLTFNRLSSTDKIEKESCNLTALVKEEVNKYLPFARSSGAEIALKTEKDITVSCNPKLMALAVDNYLSNAVKYTTGEKKIAVTLKEEKGSFTLEVFNTCEPLNEETAENIWNLFEKRDVSRTRNGSSTGMGLPICKRIFDCHGYSYGCKSTDNVVSFTVRGKL